MDEQHKKILVDISLEKAEEALECAEYNLEKGFLNTVQNRIYYALFYAVSALAYKYDFSFSKHKGIITWFNKYFVYEKKVFSNEMFIFFKDAYENRRLGDYEFTWKPRKEELITDIEEARQFILKIKNFLEEKE